MPTKALIVSGATSQWGTDGTTYQSIPEAQSLVVPTTEVEYVEATNLDSGGFREFVPGLKDAGELTIPCNYTPDLYSAAQGYRQNGTLVYFQTTLPVFQGQTSGDVFTFRGYVTPSLETNATGEIISLNLGVRTSGVVTYAGGATS